MIERLYIIFLDLIDISCIVLSAVALVHMVPQEIESRRWKRILGWTVYGILAVLLPLIGRNDILTVVVMAAWQILLARRLYFKSKMGMVYQILYCLILMGTSYIAYPLMMILYTQFQLERLTYITLVILVKNGLLVLGTVILCLVMRRRFVSSGQLRIRGMVIVPLFSMILLFMYVIGSDIFTAVNGFGWIIVFTLLLLVINIYCLYFWYDVAKNQELKHRLHLVQQQNELTLQYYKDLEENYSRSRKIIHDIRNHLHVIEEMQRTEGEAYIEDVHAMLNSLGMKFYTGNRILNIVLNDKLKNLPPEMAECNLGGVGLEFISDMDITTIFANLLDNVLEARESLPEDVPFHMSLRAEEIQDFTVVKLTNTMAGTYQEGRSSKKGHEGIGLRNVRRTVEAYGGEMTVSADGSTFSVTLVFGKMRQTGVSEQYRV